MVELTTIAATEAISTGNEPWSRLSQTCGIVDRFAAPSRSAPGGAGPAARFLGGRRSIHENTPAINTPAIVAGVATGVGSYLISEPAEDWKTGPDGPGKHNLTEVIDAIVSPRRRPSL